MENPKQQLIPIQANDAFIKAVDEALLKLGISNRSDFIRKAILEKLKDEGQYIDPRLAAPPPRAGKGGRPRKAGPAES